MVADVFGIVGSVIAGTYQVEAVVAEGGFAVVYRAHHTGFGAPVALKCLKLPQKLDSEAKVNFLAQFRAEAALLFQLSSSISSVVRPLHIDALAASDGGFVPYMVLEWLEGQTLAKLIEDRAKAGRPPLALKKLARLLTPAALALDRAHNFTGQNGVAVSIVHSDLKPENIFLANVAGEEVAKVLDFGIAKAQSVASQVAGRAGATPTLFTPAFGAPEQWAPERYGETGPWTDVYGLALTLVEAIAGRPVMEGDTSAMMGIALDELERPTPLSRGVEVPPAVEIVFQRALAVDPRERQPHAGIFWDELLVALGMKEVGRDSRREMGGVQREERVDVARGKPEVQRRAVKLRLADGSGKASSPDLDAPFESRKPPPPSPAAKPISSVSSPSLEASIPSAPPAGMAPAQPAAPRPSVLEREDSLELSLPSEPPIPRPSLESTMTSEVSRAPARAAARAPARAPIDPDLEADLSSPRAPRRDALDATLGSSYAPTAAPRRPGGDIELAEDGGLRVDLKSELPPRPTAGRVAVARGVVELQAGGGSVPYHARERRFGSLAIGLGLIGLAMAVGVADRVLRNEEGESLVNLGPLSPTAIAGVFLLIGVGLVIWRLLPRDR
jgi:eukaryotic-like serine/threonine-protein kinase